MAAHGIDAVRNVRQLDRVDLVRRGNGVRAKGFHDNRARDEKRHRELRLALLDASGLDEPVEHRLVGHDLWTAELDDLAKELWTADRLHHASRGVLAQDRLQLRLAVPRDDQERSEVRGALEVGKHSAL